MREEFTMSMFASKDDLIEALYRRVQYLEEVCEEVVGCFFAAEVEGLTEVLANTEDERLKDLVVRRLMYALYAAQEVSPTK